MKEQTTIHTYDGRTGRVTQQTVPALPGDAEQSILPGEVEEEDQTSPFFKVSALETAILNHVTRKVQQSRTE